MGRVAVSPGGGRGAPGETGFAEIESEPGLLVITCRAALDVSLELADAAPARCGRNGSSTPSGAKPPTDRSSPKSTTCQWCRTDDCAPNRPAVCPLSSGFGTT
ncbi:hypothetical protein GCM10010185_45520 [Saccharothrix coeruleofusca]|uniref:Uncharacterized protein n=1 Tax=Saccharothrix coeruleofusca TaxID=33919 RepID=A0A918EER1_9PSEU|nr:hypothetical protein GCM10010185_45520 [Saccharothrix coeruleofusca]